VAQTAGFNLLANQRRRVVTPRIAGLRVVPPSNVLAFIKLDQKSLRPILMFGRTATSFFDPAPRRRGATLGKFNQILLERIDPKRVLDLELRQLVPSGPSVSVKNFPSLRKKREWTPL
jgi:hypothetical protein